MLIQLLHQNLLDHQARLVEFYGLQKKLEIRMTMLQFIHADICSNHC